MSTRVATFLVTAPQRAPCTSRHRVTPRRFRWRGQPPDHADCALDGCSGHLIITGLRAQPVMPEPTAYAVGGSVRQARKMPPEAVAPPGSPPEGGALGLGASGWSR